MKKVFLGLLLALVFAGPVQADYPAGVSVDRLAKTSSSWDGTPLPAYPKGRPEVTILRITIPVGTVLPMHEHLVINAGVLLSGELTVTSEDNEKLVLKAGDPIVELVNKWHFGKNTGSTPAEILVFYAGSQDTPITIEK
ncbi:cupin domain-containing protein [Accumulibacter sp.]|uniref:cupin domain-containing protein n=1 Tax=Accumulibacter sp. TaxID=2053492 RepID=UPI0028C48CDE|nr:cupin domain-containing protein [Accumulibacter sp.]